MELSNYNLNTEKLRRWIQGSYLFRANTGIRGIQEHFCTYEETGNWKYQDLGT